jgi:uncharacterized protein YcbK (DUF882 family)
MRKKMSRRNFIATSGVLAAAGAITPAFANIVPAASRSLGFDCLHTGERLTVEYWAQGSYLPDALSEVNKALRDFRTGDVHPIDPRLLDLLFKLRTDLDSRESFQVISGYRSPQTNAHLHEQSAGVATHSLHMKGMAIDIRLGGRTLSDIRLAALSLRGGGVGFYPQSDFVHVDVGPVRRW